MATLTIEVPDEMVREYGLKALAKKIQRDLEWERMHRLALKLDAAVREAGLDHDQIFKESRRESWKEFKGTMLKGILPQS
jgi:hypothetical protein